MAITRRFLSALGIEADKIDEIITAHLETVNELKEARDKYKADADKLPDVQKQLDDAQNSAKDNGDFETKYNELKTEYDQYKTTVETEKANAKKGTQYRDLLRECGIPEKRLDAVMRLINLDEVKVDKDGKIEGVEEVKKSIKADWADYIPADNNQGAKVADPPAGDNGGNRTLSRAAEVAKKHYEAIYGKKEGTK